eukprot:gene10446-biopygen11525
MRAYPHPQGADRPQERHRRQLGTGFKEGVNGAFIGKQRTKGWNIEWTGNERVADVRRACHDRGAILESPSEANCSRSLYWLSTPYIVLMCRSMLWYESPCPVSELWTVGNGVDGGIGGLPPAGPPHPSGVWEGCARPAAGDTAGRA